MIVKRVIPKNGRKKVVDGPDIFRIIPIEMTEMCEDYLQAISKAFVKGGNYSGLVLVAGGNNNEIVSAVRERGLESILVNKPRDIIRILEGLYERKVKPEGVVFDYSNPRINAHVYLHDLYLHQNLHIFRNLPVTVINYSGDDSPMINKIKVLAVNGSPRKDGDTKRLLREEVDRYWTGPYYESSFIDLSHIVECVACGGHQKNCQPDCVIDDQMRYILPEVREADVLLLGSPVYMDLPTSRTIAFLSRLTGQTKQNRRAYIGKHATALSPAWCSGTKAVISSLTNALEMIGFTIQGRSTREYIGLWPDGKTRGGVPSDFYWPK